MGLPKLGILGVSRHSFTGQALGGANLPGTGVPTDFLQQPFCAPPLAENRSRSLRG